MSSLRSWLTCSALFADVVHYCTACGTCASLQVCQPTYQGCLLLSTCTSWQVCVQGLAVGASQEGLTPEQQQTLKAIRHRKTEVVAEHRSKKAVTNNQAILPRRADRDRKSNTTNLKVSMLLAFHPLTCCTGSYIHCYSVVNYNL